MFKKTAVVALSLSVLAFNTCYADKTYDNGITLTDDEVVVLETMERFAGNLVDPGSLRFRSTTWGAYQNWKTIEYGKEAEEKFRRNQDTANFCFSSKNRMGGRVTKVYSIYRDGRCTWSCDGTQDDGPQGDRDINHRLNRRNINEVYKYYHDED